MEESAKKRRKIQNLNPYIIGHRGARSIYPENTFRGYEYAIEIGCDAIEFDVVVTKDHHVICAHDPYINPKIHRWMDGSPIEKKVNIYKNLTLADIKKIDCGSNLLKKHPKQIAQPESEIPTLDEFFQLIADCPLENAKKIQFNLEMKSFPKKKHFGPEPALFAKLVVEMITKHNIQDRITIQSFDHRTLHEVKKINSDIKLAGLTDIYTLNLASLATQQGFEILCPHYRLLSRKNIEKVQEMGVKVIPWTVNRPRIWDHLMNIGVDGIITDDPKALMDHIAERKLKKRKFPSKNRSKEKSKTKIALR